MKLFLIHTGYYNKNVDNGFYEQHSNIFVIAKDAYNAREKAKKKKIFIDNKMHIDGIQEIQNIDGYDIQLSKSKSDQKNKTYNHYQVRFLKKS
tara:strand:+ start:96 stop:374 length:279 start_codon:yes stop_codon:yes gene_type:complete